MTESRTPEELNALFVERIKTEYPEQYQGLRERTNWLVDSVRNLEKRANGLIGYQSLEAVMKPDELDAAYATLAREFTDFVLVVNREEAEAAEAREYPDMVTHSFTISAGRKRQHGVGIAMIGAGDPMKGLFDSIDGSHRSGPGSEWMEELYNNPHTPQFHRRLINMPEKYRSIRAVGLGLAGWMNRGLHDGTQDMFRRDMEKAHVSTPLGNPIDVAHDMIKKAGFPERSSIPRLRGLQQGS